MHTIFELNKEEWPELLHEMNDPPKQLYCIGTPPPTKAIYLTVVGSRTPTDYGRDCVRKLVGGLIGYPIVIVSGLALGIDGMAHAAALDVGLKTVSFPGGGLEWNKLYPGEHRGLADRIISAKGCLLSEFPYNKYPSSPWVFPQRNRLMAGCSKATLIIEGRLDSGSLITTEQAFGYNRSVLAVPGSIDNPLSEGPNRLLHMHGSLAVTSAKDILEELGFEASDAPPTITPERLATLDPLSRRVIDCLENGPLNKDNLCRDLGMPMTELNPLVSFLEIDGLVRTNGNVVRRVR